MPTWVCPVTCQVADGQCDRRVGSNQRRWPTRGRPVIYNQAMWGKNLLFYFITSTIVYYVAAALGASFIVAILISMIGPAAILLAVQIMLWNGWL